MPQHSELFSKAKRVSQGVSQGVSQEWHEVKGGLGLGAVATTVLRKNHGVTRFS
jgi:hypothetical protein